MSINKNMMALTLRSHKARAFALGAAAACTIGIGAGFMSYFDYKETSAPGWHSDGLGTYYILKSTGERAIGLKQIDNATYLFDVSGIMKKGWQEYDGNVYHFNKKSGVMDKGLTTLNGEEYYFSDESGVFRTGLQDYNGDQFYFNEHGIPETGFTQNGNNYFDREGKRVSGWAEINGIQYYFYEDGDKKGQMAKGWADIKDEETGETNTYYFGVDGHMYTGVSVIKGALYDFGEAGNLQKGWTKIGKHAAYADEETGAFCMGMTKIGDDVYFFDNDFYMVTGWREIDGKKYRFDKDGKMMHGWYEENSSKYYFTEDGSAACGFIKEDYDYYFFDPEDCHLLIPGWHQYGDDWYLIDDDGKVHQGFYMFKGHWWFFDQVTHKAAVGLAQTITFTDEQKKTIDKFKSDLEKVSKFGDTKTALGLPDIPPESASDYKEKAEAFINGLIEAGYTEKQARYCEKLWSTYETADSYEYLNAAAYSKLGDKLFGQHFFGEDHGCKTGWQTYNGVRFYFDPVTGEKVTGWKTLAGKKYYFGEFGVCAVGKVRVDGKLYDFGSKGHLPSGVTKVGSEYKYVLADNRYGTNVFGRDGNKVYYFDINGNTLKGWQEVNGALYYFGTSGEILTGWQKYGTEKVYMSEQGAMKNSWLNLADGSTYYFDDSYRMATGWKEINGTWFYFGGDGKLKNGWTNIDGRTYYLDHGTPKRGVFHVDGAAYVIGAEGYCQTGWVNYNNNLYYSDENAQPICNQSKKIDGAFYSFDGEGVATRMG